MAERLFLDRIEDGVAVLLENGDGSRERHVSACDLPIGVRDGDWLTATEEVGRTVYAIDPLATSEANAKTQGLMDELLGN